MENVKGFDVDEARIIFIEMLKTQNYHFQVMNECLISNNNILQKV